MECGAARRGQRWWWLALPIFAALLARVLFVAPGQRALAHAQQSLLAAERDEMAAQVAAEAEEREVARMQSAVETLLADAERLKAAEASAKLQLSQREAYAAKPWLLPGDGTPQAATELAPADGTDAAAGKSYAGIKAAAH